MGRSIHRRGALLTLTALVLALLGTPAAHPEDRDVRYCKGKKATIVAKHNDITTQGTSRADVIVGTNQRDDIFGNGGNDTICGLDFPDRIYGGLGDDLLYGDSDHDELDGGPGNDLLHGGKNFGDAIYEKADGSVTVDLAEGTAISGLETDTLKNITEVVGSDFDDELFGDAEENVLAGGKGDDELRGRGDRDRLDGGSGADLLEGGPAQDGIDGEGGSDVASYLNAPFGIEANMKLVKEVGGPTEELSGIEGLVGTDFNDILEGDSRNNNLSGAGGNDALFGFGGTDVLDGGEGSDTLEGYSGDDLIMGGSNDPVTAHGPVPQLADLQYISGDIVVYDEYNLNVTVDLQLGTATLTGETDALEGIESVLGTFAADSDLTGDEHDNVLIGWDGFDVLKGEGGNDALYGYDGDDALVGGLGNDYLEGSFGDDHLTPGGGPARPPFVGPDTDIVDGGPQNSVTGDYLNYFDAPAAVTVNLANGTASGEGSDQITGIEWIGGSEFDDTLIGDDLTNILSGGAGDDVLSAGAADDEIDGGQGDDSADGGEGGEGGSGLPHAGDSCINASSYVNCEYEDGVPQDPARVRTDPWLSFLKAFLSGPFD